MWLTHSMVLLDVCIRWLDQSRPIGTRLLRILNLGRRWVGLPGTPPASLGTWPRLVRLTARTASASVWAFQVELGFACFVSTRHFWQLFKALVMFGSRVRLLPSDPDADRLKWSGCHFLCPHPPPAPSHLLILHPLSMSSIILITTVTFPLPLPPQNQSSILWTLCPRGWLNGLPWMFQSDSLTESGKVKYQQLQPLYAALICDWTQKMNNFLTF